jgi:molybdenum cofactor synthesis domain-containing protein
MNWTEVKVISVNISEQKGTVKKPVPQAFLGFKGISEDAHSGSWHRQISLLGKESFDRFSVLAGRTIDFGEFAENITTQGLELFHTAPLDKLVGCNVELIITQIGKKCHGDSCAIFREVGNCVMPKEGIFAKVTKEGVLTPGDKFLYKPKVFNSVVITLSDRASSGEYEDLSGPAVEKQLQEFFQSRNRQSHITRHLLPDSSEQLTELIKTCVADETDIIITTGGTGIGPRDITPDTVRPMLNKELPGIMDYIRLKYGAEKPNALLTRSLAGVAGKSLVYCLPGSVKGVTEYMTEITRILEHQIYMLHGIDAH